MSNQSKQAPTDDPLGALVEDRAARCTTHHYACDCREIARARQLADLLAENEQLRGAIEKHRVRKQDRTAIHEQPGKYGCLDVDLRLWSVLDRED